MQITDAIVNYWVSRESDIKETLNSLLSEHRQNMRQIDELKRSNENIEGEYDNLQKKYNDVYSFMEMVGISKEKLPFAEPSLDQESIMDADYESSMIEADDVVLKDRITMYQSYIDEIESVKNRNFSLDYKRRRSRYISDYELFSEIYYLESIARKKCESSSYSDYMYEKYSGAIGIYNTDNLIKVGHSEKDDIFSNGTANLVCSICKISWMITYLEALERKINELLSSKQGKSLLDKIKIDGEISKIKKVSSNSLISILLTYELIQIDSYKDKSIFLDIFKEVVDEEKLRHITRFASDVTS